jgi:hypothetical protein
VPSIDGKGLLVARLGQCHTAGVSLKIPNVSNGVRKGQGIAFFAGDGDRFLIELKRGVRTPQVALDLAKPFKRDDQVVLCPTLAASTNRLRQVLVRVCQSSLASRTQGSLQEFDDSV